jgi:hypothetical protein
MTTEIQYQVIYDLAHRRGIEASDAVKTSTENVKGAAWIVLEFGTEFSTWTKSKGLSRKGIDINREINCSRMIPDNLTHKKAYVNSFMKVLNDYGIKAVAKSRVD